MQKIVNEDVIDYDLLEDLICHVDETCDEGSILVFLPVCPFHHPFLGNLFMRYCFLLEDIIICLYCCTA